MTRQEQRKIKQQKKDESTRIREEKKEQKIIDKSFDKMIAFAKKKGAWVAWETKDIN